MIMTYASSVQMEHLMAVYHLASYHGIIKIILLVQPRQVPCPIPGAAPSFSLHDLGVVRAASLVGAGSCWDRVS
jgi:hypothetical protein